MNKSRSLYLWNRQLHLYLGLFICPFILLFAISTIFLNHSIRPQPQEQGDAIVVEVQLPQDAEPKERLDSVLQQLNLTGEIFGRGNVRNNRMIFRVVRPGQIKIVNVDMTNNTARIVERTTGLLGTLIYLYVNPGPHKMPNWISSKIWGVIADSAVYITIFLSISGIYM